MKRYNLIKPEGKNMTILKNNVPNEVKAELQRRAIYLKAMLNGVNSLSKIETIIFKRFLKGI